MMNITPVVKQLLIINIIFFIGTQIVGDYAEYLFALFYPENDHFQFWQPITHMFMHGNIMHIFFNMFALFSFGSALEHFWGGKKFFFFYVSCGLGAALLQIGVNYLELQNTLEAARGLNLSDSVLHQILNATTRDSTHYRPDLFQNEVVQILNNVGKTNLLNTENFESLYNSAVSVQTPMVGASGAIYGLLVAFAFMFPNAELMMFFIPIPIKAKYFVPGLLAVDLFLGTSGKSLFGDGPGGVAHFAHIGGAIIGFLMMWYWKKNQFHNNRWS
ncbi:membrane associated rhomboid family serine protease [Flavobacterium gossypii]|uniref:Membrane associated rhomboid family serine protease n=1 Tax=Flavobacterium gossypii TaxID=1646119 RepID=A0ABR6DM48_9FLAO|nr:rhomboid family intramembrane serine protease [Flavobacterium gossypii]MBA9072518.1 membrane associated rhomboid family serine protease [Flavobacterium gossypii]